MTDHEQGAVERYMANRRESHVDLGTVPCGICGERVRIGMNGVWSEYHDCKPVPLARLQQAERERDKARAQLEQATALLRDVRHGPGWLFLDENTRRGIEAALSEIGGGK